MYRKIKYNVILLLFLFLNGNLSFGSNLDSLETKLKSAKEDTAKVNLLDNISMEYLYNTPIKALHYAQQALALSIELKYERGIIFSHENIGRYYHNQSDYKLAFQSYSEALKFYQQNKDSSGIRRLYFNISLVYMEQGDYQNALNYTMKSLKIAELMKNLEAVSRGYNSIAQIYYYKKDYTKVQEYLLKALDIAQKINDKTLIGSYSNNLGNFFYSNDDFEKALHYFKISLQIAIEQKNKEIISVGLGSIGTVYVSKKDYPKAMEYISKAILIQEELGDKSGLITSYCNFGDIYSDLGDNRKALEYFELSCKIAQEARLKEGKKNAYKKLSEIYSKMKNFQKAYEYHQLFSSMKDTLLNEENTRSITEMNTKYETGKKEKEIEIQNLQIGKQKLELNKKQIVIYTVLSGLTLVLALVVIVFRSYHQKKKANILITYKNKELEQANEEISAQRDEIEAQRDEITAQRDTVTKQKEHIEEIYQEQSDSINYAKRIQQAVLPTDEYADNILGNHFILFKPKDIVSGDFYWATHINEWLIVTVVDCTGHGVPGAFMSMLGISFLNEIVRKKEVTQANHVLNNLRESVIEALKQKGQNREQKDGMDIALCVINMNSLEMQFAGANNPCWIVSQFDNLKMNQSRPVGVNTTCPDLSGFPKLFEPVSELVELKGDKMPIGIHDSMNSFTNQFYQLQKGDTIYMMSDGYEDQFGGPNRKKFLAKNLKQLITANSQKPMADQKQVLETTITEWIDNGEQIDDITVMGLKV